MLNRFFSIYLVVLGLGLYAQPAQAETHFRTPTPASQPLNKPWNSSQHDSKQRDSKQGDSKTTKPERPPPFGSNPRKPGIPQVPGQPPTGFQECRSARGEYFARPHINIYRVKKTGGFFGAKYRVQGDIEGVCLAEAGYFESGRKVQNLQIRTSRDFQRYQFEVTIQSDRQPELRAYNVNGDSDIIYVDPNQYPG